MSQTTNEFIDYLAQLRKDLDAAVERIEKLEERNNRGTGELFKEIDKLVSTKDIKPLV